MGDARCDPCLDTSLVALPIVAGRVERMKFLYLSIFSGCVCLGMVPLELLSSATSCFRHFIPFNELGKLGSCPY